MIIYTVRLTLECIRFLRRVSEPQVQIPMRRSPPGVRYSDLFECKLERVLRGMPSNDESRTASEDHATVASGRPRAQADWILLITRVAIAMWPASYPRGCAPGSLWYICMSGRESSFSEYQGSLDVR